MTTFDRRFLFIILAPILPIFLLLSGWWTSLLFFRDSRVFMAALTGLTMGVVLDVKFLPSWIKDAYRMHLSLWLLIYLFYSVCFFGFFMGVPVFSLFLSLPVGIFTARQAKVLKYSQEKLKKRVNAASITSALYMILTCICSAVIALKDPYTAANLEGMFNLSFKVTSEMINWLILLGGAFLVVTQYILTKFSALLTLRRLRY